MSIQAINASVSVDSTPVTASKPINPDDVAAFQAMVSGSTAAPTTAQDATQAGVLAEFHKQAQYDIVKMGIQYIPTFRD